MEVKNVNNSPLKEEALNVKFGVLSLTHRKDI
jgi:hypothetical protein